MNPEKQPYHHTSERESIFNRMDIYFVLLIGFGMGIISDIIYGSFFFWFSSWVRLLTGGTYVVLGIILLYASTRTRRKVYG